MKARRKKLASAIQIAVFLAIPAVAVAQEATTLDTVTVTGSRIKQTNAVTAQPVFVLDREKIAQTGVQSVGEILQQLTAGGKALNEVPDSVQWTSPGGKAMTARFLTQVPITKDNLELVVEAGWIPLEVLCQGVKNGPAPCN